jgi:hypothetical protein
MPALFLFFWFFLKNLVGVILGLFCLCSSLYLVTGRPRIVAGLGGQGPDKIPGAG